MDNTRFQDVNATDGRAFDWNDTIENDSEFVLLPAGEYSFTVSKFERGRHSGSEKLPPCNKAILTLTVYDDKTGNKTELKHNLFLHTKCEGMLCSFFTSIGQRKRGEQLVMNWQRVTGAGGRCKLGVREWKGDDGALRQSNEIKSFIEPKETLAKGFTPGDF